MAQTFFSDSERLQKDVTCINTWMLAQEACTDLDQFGDSDLAALQAWLARLEVVFMEKPYIQGVFSGYQNHILYSANELDQARHKETLKDILRQAPDKNGSLDFLLDTVADTLMHIPDMPDQADRKVDMAHLRTLLCTTKEADKADTAIDTILDWVQQDAAFAGPATQCLQALWMRSQAATATMLTPFQQMVLLGDISGLQPDQDRNKMSFSWQYNETGIVCETRLPCRLVYVADEGVMPVLSVTLVSKQTYDFQKGCVIDYSERIKSLQVAEDVPDQHQVSAAKVRVYFAEYEQFLALKNAQLHTKDLSVCSRPDSGVFHNVLYKVLSLLAQHKLLPRFLVPTLRALQKQRQPLLATTGIFSSSAESAGSSVSAPNIRL